MHATLRILAAWVALASAQPRVHAQDAEEDDPEPKLSLATESDRRAWERSGFRLGLGLVYGQLVGLEGTPGGSLIGPVIRVGLRLDAAWSVTTSFQYLSVSGDGGLSGLRFAGTIDPTFNLTPNLSIALGFGFGGLVEATSRRFEAAPRSDAVETSYTYPDTSRLIDSCSGVGAAALLRVEWGYVLGPRSQTHLALEGVGQWTGCVADTGRVEPDTGTAIVDRQWWPHAGVTLSWGVVWR